MHTPSGLLLSYDILTKRTPEVEFVQYRSELLGIAHIQAKDSLQHTHMKRSDHAKLCPVVQCTAIADYDEAKKSKQDFM